MSAHRPTHGGKNISVVLVGGLDPGAGAGVLRDLLVATTLGAQAVVVGTAWTVQGSPAAQGSFFDVDPRDPERVRHALRAALAEAGTESTSVKIGMIATAAIAQAVLATLAPFAGPVVYDPVLRASSGGSLYDGGRESVLALARRATLLTPNLDEAAWLLDRPVRTQSDARNAARDLRDLGISAVLVKGGHLEGDATDVLRTPAGESLLSCPRIAGPSPRGTGCALATAIATLLAGGQPLELAVATAKTWLTRRIANACAAGDERHL